MRKTVSPTTYNIKLAMDIKKNIYPDLARHGFVISSETSTVRIGDLTYESPIHLWENSSLYGPCSIGAYSYMNRFAMFYNLHIGRFCSIAGYVRGAGDHDFQFSTHPIWTDMNRTMFASDPTYIKITEERFNEFLKKDQPVQKESAIQIGNDVWIGENVLIRAGVSIGNGAIIGANSFVRDDVSAYSVVAGSPAVVKKMRYSDKLINEFEKLNWWLYNPTDFFHLVDKGNVKKTIEAISEGIAVGSIGLLKPDRFLLSQEGDSFKLERLAYT